MNHSTENNQQRWNVDTDGIAWNVARDARLPHFDHVEMSGRGVSVIAHYAVDAHRVLQLKRKIIWPTLRRKKNDVRGFLWREYDDSDLVLRIDGATVALPPLKTVRFDGALRFEHETINGLKIERALFPFVHAGGAGESWTLHYEGAQTLNVEIVFPIWNDSDRGVYGDYVIQSQAATTQTRWALKPNESATCGQIWTARKASDAAVEFNLIEEKSCRENFARRLMSESLQLETPDAVLNRLFAFAKLRAAESHFDTKMGLVHSPGGGNFYGGVWANDQAEYAGPFFPFLGDELANHAALNCYRIFAAFMTPEYDELPSSLEVEGDVEWRDCGDRGDAAMIAYGASRFALARGDEEIAREILPIVQWCLEYFRRKLNADGVVASDTDELEGRFPSGDANLSTSTLYLGGLQSGADLCRALGENELAADLDARHRVLDVAIENYFGANVEGFETYRYYEGNDVLRAWICLPLTMGVFRRSEETLRALFSARLWTPDGLATQAGERTYWDRATLYGLRGAFNAGATQTALDFLQSWARRRLLGDHVPYAIEAFPENAGAHLSAESALLCRVFVEGMFGIVPRGLRAFDMAPRLPAEWNEMSLRDVRAFGFETHGFDVTVERSGDRIAVRIERDGDVLFQQSGEDGATFHVDLTACCSRMAREIAVGELAPTRVLTDRTTKHISLGS